MKSNVKILLTSLHRTLRGCIQKFPDWSPGARTANGTAPLPLGAIVSLFSESV